MTSPARGPWSGESDGLVGRDEVLVRLRDVLGEGRRTAVVTGLPGVGKTAVLSAVARAAAGEGRHVLWVTCYPSEREVAMAALVDLLGSDDSGSELLDLVVSSPAPGGATDPLRLRLRVLDWLERVGEKRATLVVVDDVHWSDASSLSVLAFAANRLTGSDVSALFAIRGDRVPEPLAACSVVALGPLGTADSQVLLRRAGLDLDALTLPSVIGRAAGNPLALLELGRAARSPGTSVSPSSVEAAFATQVAGLSERAQWLLLLAAACDGDLEALARLVRLPELVEDLEPAERAGLVRFAARRLVFRHPLARAAAYSTSTTAARLRAHQLLAEAYGDDVERRAWHRGEACVVADESVAVELAAAGGHAAARGAAAEATRLLNRAAELTPDPHVRELRLLDAAFADPGADNYEWMARIGARLRDDSDDPVIRARAAHMAAYGLSQTKRHAAARAALIDALGRLLDVDLMLGWSTLTTLAVLTYRVGGSTTELTQWRDRYRDASRLTPPELPDLCAAGDAWVTMVADPLSRPPQVLAHVQQAQTPDGYSLKLAASAELVIGGAAWLLDEPRTALDRLTRSVDLLRRADAPGELTQTLLGLVQVQFDVGDYDAAEDGGRLVVDIGEARRQSYAVSDGLEIQARVAGMRGEVATARALCDRVLLDQSVGECLALEACVRVTMSWVRLAEDDVPGAWDELRWLFAEDGEPRHRHISYRSLGHVVATAVRSGALDAAGTIVHTAGRRLAEAGPRHRLQLARARALLAGEDAEPWHHRATSDSLAGQWPLELALAQLEYGAWLRRRHRPTEARAQLTTALDVFTRLGAVVSVRQAQAELRAAGVVTDEPRSSAWSLLTGQERQVVRLAAAGQSNREIAAALYLSPRTVSTHLYNAFPKLGVTSRAQLRDLMT